MKEKPPTSRQVQSKLNTLATLAQELQEEAVRRYGKDGFLFYECEGQFHIMSGDSEGSASARQAFVKFSSKPLCCMGCGAW